MAVLDDNYSYQYRRPYQFCFIMDKNEKTKQLNSETFNNFNNSHIINIYHLYIIWVCLQVHVFSTKYSHLSSLTSYIDQSEYILNIFS